MYGFSTPAERALANINQRVSAIRREATPATWNNSFLEIVVHPTSANPYLNQRFSSPLHPRLQWELKDVLYPASCAVPSLYHGQQEKCLWSQAVKGQITGFCLKVDGSPQTCSWRLQPREKHWKKVLPFAPLTVSSPPDDFPHAPLLLLLHVRSTFHDHSRRTWHNNPIRNNNTITLGHLSLLRTGRIRS